MKPKSVFICNNCGAQYPKWQGKCNQCGTWESLAEQFYNRDNSNKIKKVKLPDNAIHMLSEIETNDEYRLRSGFTELDRVLGGGIVPASIVLIGGDPGIGKSTLVLQMCANLQQFQPLYITGEESLQQIKLRASRLKNIPENLLLASETNIEIIVEIIKSTNSGVVIVDSIQSVYSDRIPATPGSVSQVRECALLLMQTAKKSGKAIFIIGHVTKEGIIAGPKILEHMVDTVLQFEGEKTHSYRIIRSIKNRFGSTNEIGIFNMSDSGLYEVTNPSEIFIADRELNEPGIAIVSSIEGSRPILLEIQALVSFSNYSVPQRTANGFDNKRLQMIIAVLEKRLGIQFRQNDIFVNVAGGVYLSDPSVDLGVAAALVSSFRDIPVQEGSVLIGEVGLTGEVRSVSHLNSRISEAVKLGYKRIIVPRIVSKAENKFESINLIQVERISTALTHILE